jgi:hypothetical protein
MTQAALATGVGEEHRAIGGSVVGEEGLRSDALEGVPVEGSLEESRRRFAFLVRENLHVGKAGVVVDADVGALPARPLTQPPAVSGGAVPRPTDDASELLDVQVQ